jgi:hypothetical protein
MQLCHSYPKSPSDVTIPFTGLLPPIQVDRMTSVTEGSCRGFRDASALHGYLSFYTRIICSWSTFKPFHATNDISCSETEIAGALNIYDVS